MKNPDKMSQRELRGELKALRKAARECIDSGIIYVPAYKDRAGFFADHGCGCCSGQVDDIPKIITDLYEDG